MPDALKTQATLVRNLAARFSEPHAGPATRIFETHLSWVIVAGSFAWKIKKAVRLDFVDFSTLDARRFYCEEELRLNRRLAPTLYLSVDTIGGTPDQPLTGSDGIPIEYAVRMRAFDQSCLWAQRVQNKSLSAAEIDTLASRLARFHQTAQVAPADTGFGSARCVCKIADDNLQSLFGLADAGIDRSLVERLAAWQTLTHQALADAFDRRKAGGFVRECHGDLHAANILTLDGEVVAFDCIEFSEPLRWIDVVSDIAFLCMDLDCRGLPALSARLRDRYLANTGDYEGVAVWRYYAVQRALVRAKVAALRVVQAHCGTDRSGAPDTDAAPEAISGLQEAATYLACAARMSGPAIGVIMITHGLSGSGKSTFSERVVEATGAIRLRSDVERKRLHGIAPATDMAAPVGQGLYADRIRDRVYRHLWRLTRQIAGAGFPVVVDAAFLDHRHRDRFKALALAMHVPFFIFDLKASEAMLLDRVAARQALQRDASDAGLAVLHDQLARRLPLADDERTFVLAVDAQTCSDAEAVLHACRPVLAALQSAAMAKRDD
jgi:aminoglycoside phosphotransferase family enzyme/predicted kinase